MKINGKLGIDEKFRIDCPIIQPAKISRKIVSVLKRTLEFQVSNEADPNHLGLLFLEKLSKTHGAIFLKHFKRLLHGFCINFVKMKSSHGWGQSHFKPDIQRSVLSTEPFLRDILGL